ncbi:MAG: hypothetical protein JOZ86_02220 [Candidatus Eremiobacteraeota bacterium]|nr:hypothetical protein [Candidatus Eremiobacteraeota bacterium]
MHSLRALLSRAVCDANEAIAMTVLSVYGALTVGKADISIGPAPEYERLTLLKGHT